MNQSIDPKSLLKALARCVECDRETEHYNVHVSSTNEESVVCWECLGRSERGFNTKRDFHREARSGIIPR